MKLHCFLLLPILVATVLSQDQTFTLKDGTVVVGSVQQETETTYIIQTKYGSITVNKNELVKKAFEVKLKGGEIFTGTKLSETENNIILKTQMGELSIKKSDILDLKEVGQTTLEGGETPIKYKKPYNPFGVFGEPRSDGSEKDVEFALGEERLIDTFFDPTAYVLDNGTLYLSGLSFGFGLSDKLMVTTQWSAFSWGDFNIRPKYRLFQKGNWEKESALAVGGHFHTFWQPNKVEWQEDNITNTVITINDNGEIIDTTTNALNYGGYFPLGSTVEGVTINKYPWGHENDNGEINVKETEDLGFMFELFAAYTFSKARKGMRGRISNTIGASVQIPLNHDTYPYRIYWGLDVDITPKLKMLAEAFYDPFFLDIFNAEGTFDMYTYKVSLSELTEDDFRSVRPVHFDFGFIYAVNEHFRFGIHTQPYIIAFYWKF